MMKKWFFLSLILIVALLAGCAPGSSPAVPPAAATNLPTDALPTVTLAATLESRTQAAPNKAATVVPLATSRGPNLEATDPTAVRLASGGLQLVEFFRFT